MGKKIQLILNTPINDAISRHTEQMSLEKMSRAYKFHRSIPGYNPSLLVRLPELSKTLGISELLIKDESRRFDLNSFKILGASYGIARVINGMFQKRHREVTFEALFAQREQLKNLTFVTATDGNHGFAVGWFANKIGSRAVIIVPAGTSGIRVKEIENTGAAVSVIDGNYDDAVLFAHKTAGEKNWILIQDSSWKGYMKIPVHIMQGYTTILNEFISQEEETWPTHVFVQAGVGSLAAAMLSFFYKFRRMPAPRFAVVEPSGAPCYFDSITTGDGRPHRFRGSLDTIMTGLSCGQPSLLAWNILRSGADCFIKCADDMALRGMEICANPVGSDSKIQSGPSGAVTMGLIHEVLTDNQYSDLKKKLHLNHTSKVLLVSTEGPPSS